MIYGLVRGNKLIGYTLNKKSIPSEYRYVIYKSLVEYNLHKEMSMKQHILIADNNSLEKYTKHSNRSIRECAVLLKVIHKLNLSSAYVEYLADRIEDDDIKLSPSESKKLLLDFLMNEI